MRAKQFFIWVLLVCAVAAIEFAGTAHAAIDDTATRIQPTLVLGSGILFERGNDASRESARLPISMGAGARWNRWGARIEYASFRTTDGNQTISVSREQESLLTWVTYEFGQNPGWTPYAATGIGVGRTSAETRFQAVSETAKGLWLGKAAVAGGLRAHWADALIVRPEIRYELAETFKTKDARAGVFVQIDFLF